jgi:hypothetical protein
MLTPRPVIEAIYNLVSSVQVKSIDAYLDSFSKYKNFSSCTIIAIELQDSLTFLIKILSASSIFCFVDHLLLLCIMGFSEEWFFWGKKLYMKCAQTVFPRAQMHILRIRGQFAV